MNPTETVTAKERLSLLGGEAAVQADNRDIFHWPIITKEHEEAVLEVLRRGAMSSLDVTRQFEDEYAKAIGRKYALAYHNGTAAIQGGLYGLGVGVGDEVICPSVTFWASILQAYSLGATPVFADINPDTMCLDPKDMEKRITPRTKAIVAVHYSGMPAEMDTILEIAKRHGIAVMEDGSHAHGAKYKGREIGTMGDAAGFSLMSGKSFPAGEAGILFTDSQRVYERALLFGHYIRHGDIQLADLQRYAGVPCGGYKHRIHQLSSALGRVQLKLYPRQMAEIDKAMNYFCDLLEGVRGIRAIRPAKGSGSTKGGWYYPLMKFRSEELGGLSLNRFAEAIRAEGSVCNPGCNKPLHTHPVFTEMDIYGHGRPTRIANLPAGARIEDYVQKLPVAERILQETFEGPWFKKYYPEVIEAHARAYRKVLENYAALLPGDPKIPVAGGWSSFFNKQKPATEPKI